MCSFAQSKICATASIEFVDDQDAIEKGRQAPVDHIRCIDLLDGLRRIGRLKQIDLILIDRIEEIK